MGRIDYSLYLVTDRALARGRPLADVVRAAVAGGVTCVQLREKEASAREFAAAARELLSLLRPLGVPLIVNDRIDVALAAGADGVHVGQQDLSVADARRLGPPGWIVGVSAESAADAARAERDGADYVGANTGCSKCATRVWRPAMHTSRNWYSKAAVGAAIQLLPTGMRSTGCLDVLVRQRQILEKEVALMSDGSLERDMLDEKARSYLNMSRADEIVIFH